MPEKKTFSGLGGKSEKIKPIPAGFGIGEEREKEEKSPNKRLTQDQKIYRIITWLYDKGEATFGIIELQKYIGTGQRSTDMAYFEKWLDKNGNSCIIAVGDEGKKEYKIGDNGKLLVDTLRDLMTQNPKNPIFKFDVFNPTEMEEKTPYKKKKFDQDLAIKER